jgi:hypothetical protein
MDPALRIIPFVRKEEELAKEKSSSGATNYPGKIRRVPDSPVRKQVFDLLSVGLCLLLVRSRLTRLVRKRWNSGGFVVILKNCRNHKKPPPTMQATCLTKPPEAATLFYGGMAIGSSWCHAKLESSLIVFSFVP